MPIYGIPDKVTNPTFDKEKFKGFIPRYAAFVDSEEGEPLYDLFVVIADDQIYSNVWGIKWTLAMSYCIAHYIDILNSDRESSYSLNESKKDSGIKGVVVTKDEVSYSTDDLVVGDAFSKFWNTSEYGRRLITLLKSIGVITMIVVN